MEKKLCCLVNPELFCEGCGIELCATCGTTHKGATGKCIQDLRSDVFTIKSYQEVRKQLSDLFEYDEEATYE